MIKRLIWTPMSSVPKKADKLNLSLSLSFRNQLKKLNNLMPDICSIILTPIFFSSLENFYSFDSHSFPFLIESRGSSSWRLFTYLTVPWVVITTTCGAVGGGGVVGLMIFCFRCSISMISAQFHCDTSLQCACCVVKLLYYARIISPEYHYRIIFLFSL